ncbi:hypothetical protein HDU99_003613, partial [Rhizoclosmatium hyalinum]
MFVTIVLALLALTIGSLLQSYIQARIRAAELRRLNPTLHIEVLFIDVASPLRALDLLPQWLPMRVQNYNVWRYKYGYSSFIDYGNVDAFAFVDSKQATIQIRDPFIGNDIMVNRSKELTKPVRFYGIIDVYGQNIVSTEGDIWRRHKRAVAPVFGERNNALVHEVTVNLAQKMFESWEMKDKDEFLVNTLDDCENFALSVISAAGFGISLEWDEKGDKANTHHRMTFRESMKKVIQYMPWYYAILRSVLSLPVPAFNDAKVARDEFGKYLDEMIDQAIDNPGLKASNILQALAQASVLEKESHRLTKPEIKADGFVMILAGHETTANTLTFALALLALHPEIQERLREA